MASSLNHAVASPAASYDATADPRSVVLAGHARFTVLTPQVIRMEWSADGKFEDHASFVFLNRRLPVPNFSVDRDGKRLTLKTEALQLHYDGGDAKGGKFSADDLTVDFTLDGKLSTWHPGMADTENLHGTTRTLDGALAKRPESRSGRGWSHAQVG